MIMKKLAYDLSGPVLHVSVYRPTTDSIPILRLGFNETTQNLRYLLSFVWTDGSVAYSDNDGTEGYDYVWYIEIEPEDLEWNTYDLDVLKILNEKARFDNINPNVTLDCIYLETQNNNYATFDMLYFAEKRDFFQTAGHNHQRSLVSSR